MSPAVYTVYTSLEASEFLMENSETGDICIVALCYLYGEYNFIHIYADCLNILCML